MVTTDAVRALKWYSALAWLFFGLGPPVLVGRLVAVGRTPSSVGLLLIGGVPLLLVALVSIVRGFRETDPEQASHRLRLGMACVAGADVLLLGGNAIIRMIAE